MAKAYEAAKGDPDALSAIGFSIMLNNVKTTVSGQAVDIVQRVNLAVNQTVADPEVREKLARLGIEATGGTPAQFQTLIKTEFDKWRRIIIERKITAD